MYMYKPETELNNQYLICPKAKPNLIDHFFSKHLISNLQKHFLHYLFIVYKNVVEIFFRIIHLNLNFIGSVFPVRIQLQIKKRPEFSIEDTRKSYTDLSLIGVQRVFAKKYLSKCMRIIRGKSKWLNMIT